MWRLLCIYFHNKQWHSLISYTFVWDSLNSRRWTQLCCPLKVTATSTSWLNLGFTLHSQILLSRLICFTRSNFIHCWTILPRNANSQHLLRAQQETCPTELQRDENYCWNKNLHVWSHMPIWDRMNSCFFLLLRAFLLKVFNCASQHNLWNTEYT